VSAGRAVADVAEFAALLGAADINGISGSVVLGSVDDECVTTNDTTVSVCVEVRHRVSPMVVCMRGLWRVTESGSSEFVSTESGEYRWIVSAHYKECWRPVKRVVGKTGNWWSVGDGELRRKPGLCWEVVTGTW